MLRWVVLLILICGAAAYVSWPPINVVETGRTPEYPDLDPRSYAVVSTSVYSAAAEAIASMPHWQIVGAARARPGPQSTRFGRLACSALRTT